MIRNSHEWKDLEALKKGLKPELAKWFSEDPDRAKSLSIWTDHIIYDFSRQIVNGDITDALLKLADKSGLKDKIKAMFAGEKINQTEDRAVLHVALRNLNGKDALPDALIVHHERKLFRLAPPGQRGMGSKSVKGAIPRGKVTTVAIRQRVPPEIISGLHRFAQRPAFVQV